MTDKDQFAWMAYQACPDPEFSDADRRGYSDILEAIAGELRLSPQQLWADIQKIIDEKMQPETEEDSADWWKAPDPQ
jgi:hypothetical protein